MKTIHDLSAEQLREICVLTLELTRLRQNECKHLHVENIAPEIFGKLIAEALQANGVTVEGEPQHELRIPRHEELKVSA